MGTDELVGLLESLGAEIANGVIASAYLDRRKLYSWTPATSLPLADLTHRRGAGYGVTNELSSMTPYDVPQSWATAIDQIEGCEGVQYRARFDPGDVARAVAHFGATGRARRPVGVGSPIGTRLRERLEDECHLQVVGAPNSDELTIVSPDW